MFEFIGIVIAVVALVMVIHLKNKVEHLEQKLSVRKDGVVQIPKGADADLQHSDIGDHKYDDVVEYIKKQVEEGIGTEDISRNLAQAGWQENDISVVLLRAGVASHEDSGISVNADVVEEPGENPFTAFFTWLTNDWLMKLGAFLILIAFGWFVTYAFAQNWIGPIGRITIGIVIGLAIMLLGEWRIREYKNQGAVLLSLGAAGILMTIFAARMIYDFFTPATALLFMFAVVVYLGLSSVRYKSKALAVLAIVLGFAVPLLTNSPSPDFASLFMYLLVVSGGVLWVAGITGWRPLILLSLIGMFLYSFAAFDGAARSTETFLFVLSLVFAGMYFITSMAAIVSSRKAYLSDLFTAAGVGAFTLMWIMVHFDQVWWSLGTAALALIFAVTAFAVYNITQMKEPFYVYGSVALVLIGVATALELEGPALTIAAIFEAVMVVGLIKAVLQDMNLARRATLLLVIPGVLSLGSIGARSWNWGVWHGDFAVLLLMMITLLSLGAYFYTERENADEGGLVEGALFVFSGLYGLVLIWLISHALLGDDAAIMLTLTLYTVIGLYFYLTGMFRKIGAFKISGGILLGFVVIRLFPLAWELPLVGRVIIFTLIGALLMSTAFIGKINNKKLPENNE